MNDNVVNISSLVHRQIDLMERYHNTVNDSMERIDNCIQELLSLQQGRDRDTRILSRRMGLSAAGTAARERIETRNNSTGTTYRYPSFRRASELLNPTSSMDGGSRNRQRVRPSGIHSPFRATTTASNTPLPVRTFRNRARNQMFREQLESANLLPRMNRGRNYRFPTRRMTLQEFINSTMTSGNPRIPAQENEIMQQTSMIGFEDLSGTNITLCPISLTPFDASSNILRINECNHVFDSDSLMRWFREDSRCPLCRYNISNRNGRPSATNRSMTNDVSGGNTETTTYNDSVDEQIEQENNEEVGLEEVGLEEEDEEELPGRSAIIYDISFSIPQLFGRDMSDNQIDSIIDSITSTITNSMNQSLSNYSLNLGNGEEMVVEEMVFEISGNNIRDYNQEGYGSEAETETESTSYLEDSENDMDVGDDNQEF